MQEKSVKSDGLSSFDVPTIDEDVRAVLRKLGQPVTYFGEDKPDRRARLLKLVNEAKHTNFGDNFELDGDSHSKQVAGSSSDDDSDDEEFYTPGTSELLTARKGILTYSLTQAKRRLEDIKSTYERDFIKVLKHRRLINQKVSKFQLYGTQLIPNNQRAISTVRYNKTNEKIACGSWDGNVYILDTQLNLVTRSTPGYHTEKASGLDWKEELLITGGAEGNINYWDTNTNEKLLTPKTTINAHEGRVSKTLFHPNGQNFVSTSFDQTWKLWDFEKATELMQQEGHSKEVFCGDFQCDGSILATGGLDAIVKLWDLRSGKLINNLTSHIQGIYSLAWNPNGYQLVSGSGDCSIKVWDIRKLNNSVNDPQKEIFSIPAHKKLISDLKFYKKDDHTASVLEEPVTDEHGQNSSVLSSNGTFLISSSYDKSTSIWSTDNWTKLAELPSTDKVMSCDVSKTGDNIISCHWDKSIKLWSL